MPVLLVMLLLAFGVVKQVFFGIPFGAKLAPDGVLLILLLAFAIFFVFMFFLSLVTEVDDSIKLRFFPIPYTRTIDLSAINNIEVTTYNGLTDHGGRGKRTGPFGTAFTMRGDRALKLVLNGGEQIIIGSQRVEELRSAIALKISR